MSNKERVQDMENDSKNSYNKRYDKQNYNNKQKDKEIAKQIEEFDKKLEQTEIKITKELEEKQTEWNQKMEEKKDEMIRSLYDNLDEQIKISIGRKLKDEEKKIIGNRTRKIIVRDIIIVLLIALIGYLAYCLYDLDFHNIKTIVTNKEKIVTAIEDKDNKVETINTVTEDNTKKEEKIEKEKSSKYYVENYGYLMDNLQITGNNEFYLYQNTISREQIPNKVKLQISYKNLDNNKKIYEDGVVTFQAEDLLERCKEIFGKDISMNHEIFDYNNNKFLYHNDNYIVFLENKEQSKSNVIYKIENAYEKDNKLMFEVIAAKKQENKLMNILTEQIITETYNGEDILAYKDSLSRYKFIYTKVDDNYYFEKVEREGTIIEI